VSELINKLMFGVFELFVLFVSVYVLVTMFLSSPLIGFMLFLFLIYFAYYLGIKYFFNEL